MKPLDIINEVEAAKAFSRQSLVFDEYDAGNTIIHYKRKRVREHVLRHMLNRNGDIKTAIIPGH